MPVKTGRRAQDPANHPSKIVRISPADGSVEIVARRPQRPAPRRREAGHVSARFRGHGRQRRRRAESTRVADLLDRSQPHNFGRGKFPADHWSREGTFYINSGGGAMAMAPVPEPGFIQPIAQFGREARRTSPAPDR
jgi:hypothetical protein